MSTCSAVSEQPASLASVGPALATTTIRLPPGAGTAAGGRTAAVSVGNVSKAFRLPHQQYHTLKERALHPFRSSTYDILQAVDDVSVVIAEGEFFGIIGRNGSGKSTLLK